MFKVMNVILIKLQAIATEKHSKSNLNSTFHTVTSFPEYDGIQFKIIDVKIIKSKEIRIFEV